VPATLEQLHYTWTPRGVEGVNRFQIAAMSAGFKTSLRPVLPVVRKICRYDRPKADRTANPTSFGWFDHRQHRIAFLRVGLPPIRGKVGNFAAHVLVGPPQVLREGELASTFGASFWWRGHSPEDLDQLASGTRDLELPLVDLDDVLATSLEPGTTPSPEALALAHALVSLPDDRRLAVTGSDDTFGAALRVIGWRLPEALEGRSLSTYEGTGTFPFRVVGTRNPTGRQELCSLAEPAIPEGTAGATLERLLSRDHQQSALRAAAAYGGHTSVGSLTSLWSRARQLVGALTDDEDTDPISPAAIANPDSIVFLATSVAGRARIAEAVRSGSAAVQNAVRIACDRLDENQCAQLYAAITARYLGGEPLRGCGATAQIMLDPDARATLLEGAYQAALADEAAARSLEGDDVAAVVAHSAQLGRNAQAMASLLEAAAQHVGRCAADPAIPDQHVAMMLAHLLQETSDGRSLATVVRLRPRVLGKLELTDGAKDRCCSLLRELKSEQRSIALAALLPALSDANRGPQIAELFYSLPPSAAAQCMLSAELDDPIASDLSRVCDDLAAEMLTRAQTAGTLDARQHEVVARELLERSRSADHPLALRLLHGVRNQPIAALRGAPTIQHRNLRSALQTRALDAAIDDLRRTDDVRQIWEGMRAADPHATDIGILRRLLGHAAGRRGSMADAMLLAWVARDLLPANTKLLSVNRRLRDRQADELAHDIARSVPLWCFEELEPYLADADRRFRAWWHALVSNRRKLEPATPHR
jgi:GTPase-associated protein 1